MTAGARPSLDLPGVEATGAARAPAAAGRPSYTMRAPCATCGTRSGFLDRVGAQDVVRCAVCRRGQYCAPRTETGRAVRTVASVHAAIRPAQRARILARDAGRCVVCGARGGDLGLHVGHLVPVAGGLLAGLTQAELNSDDNLAAMCAACNLGLGEAPPPLWLVVPLLKMRVRR